MPQRILVEFIRTLPTSLCWWKQQSWRGRKLAIEESISHPTLTVTDVFELMIWFDVCNSLVKHYIAKDSQTNSALLVCVQDKIIHQAFSWEVRAQQSPWKPAPTLEVKRLLSTIGGAMLLLWLGGETLCYNVINCRNQGGRNDQKCVLHLIQFSLEPRKLCTVLM